MRKTSKVVDLVEETSSKVKVWKIAETKVEERVEDTSETKLMRKTKTMMKRKTMLERKIMVKRKTMVKKKTMLETKTPVVRDSLD